MSRELYRFVAGEALESNALFNVKCNCGGDAPIQPLSCASYHASESAPRVKIVDVIATSCRSCGKSVIVNILQGDPGYMLMSIRGVESLWLPQGSRFEPVEVLSLVERNQIIRELNDRLQRC